VIFSVAKRLGIKHWQVAEKSGPIVAVKNNWQWFEWLRDAFAREKRAI
jgi:hypothetical protein